MTTTQVVETSVTVNNNSAIQDYVHLDDETQPTFPILSLPPRNFHVVLPTKNVFFVFHLSL